MTKTQHATVYRIFEANPELSKIEKAATAVKNGAVIIYPTDTVYAIGCDLYNTKGIERITKIKSFSLQKPIFSIICADISQVARYSRMIGNDVFKIMKKVLPGPYTFVLEANNKIPKALNQKRKTIGVRVPDNEITLALVRALGNPLITTSVKEEDDIVEYYTDPQLIADKFSSQVDVIIEGGLGGNSPSTIINCANGNLEVIREGLGKVDSLF